MLRAEHLTKYYAGIAAIRDVNFSVQPGQVLGSVHTDVEGTADRLISVISQ